MAHFQTDVALDSDIRIKNGQRMWLRLSLLYKLCLHHHLLKLILKLQTIKNRSSKLRINMSSRCMKEMSYGTTSNTHISALVRPNCNWTTHEAPSNSHLQTLFKTQSSQTSLEARNWSKPNVDFSRYVQDQQGDHQVWDYVWEGPGPDHHQVVAQYKQLSTHHTNSI